MDKASAAAPSPRPSTDAPSLSTTLQDQPPSQGTNTRQPYTYIAERKAPNPDAQPKQKGKLSTWLSKFKSPAVKGTTSIRDREALEQERTGVKKAQVTDTGRSSNAWVLS